MVFYDRDKENKACENDGLDWVSCFAKKQADNERKDKLRVRWLSPITIRLGNRFKVFVT